MSAGNDRITEAQVRREFERIDDRDARRRTGIGAVVIVVAALVAGVLAAKLLFALAAIRTDGMAGVLNTGDIALCIRSDAPYLAQTPERGDLALVNYRDLGMQRQTVRRVIALAGDEVYVDIEGRVTLNGEALEEPYATYRSLSEWTGDEVTPGGALENPFATEETPAPQASTEAESNAGVDDMDYPITVPEGEAFVLCDNRANLLDSRSSRFGLVSGDDLQGVARAILWPACRVELLSGGAAGG